MNIKLIGKQEIVVNNIPSLVGNYMAKSIHLDQERAGNTHSQDELTIVETVGTETTTYPSINPGDPGDVAEDDANDGYYDSLASTTGLDVASMREIRHRESHNHRFSTNGDCKGLYQLDTDNPAWSDPVWNTQAAAEYIKYGSQRYGTAEAALAFHNSHGWY